MPCALFKSRIPNTNLTAKDLLTCTLSPLMTLIGGNDFFSRNLEFGFRVGSLKIKLYALGVKKINGLAS